MDEFLYRARPWAVTLVAHNWPILLYSPLAAWLALRAYAYPSRPALAGLYGLLVLTLAFEYRKHLAEVVLSTLDYLFALEARPALRGAVEVVVVEVLSVALHLGGVALLLVGVRRAWRTAKARREGSADGAAGRAG